MTVVEAVGAVRSPEEAGRHTRRAPSEWEGLLAHAGEQLDGPELSDEAIQSLFDRVSALSHQELEANRYYSFGLMICNLARGLQDPAVRDRAVDVSGEALAGAKYNRAAQSLFGWRRLVSEPPRFTLSDLHPASLITGLGEPIAAAAEALPAETRFLADTLTSVSNNRRSVTGRREDLTPARCEQIRGGLVAAARLHDDSMSGASYAFDLGYRTRHKLKPGANPAVTSGELRELDIKAAAAQLASLYLDTFTTHTSQEGNTNCVVENSSGQLRVDPAVLKAEPRMRHKPGADQFTIHETPLGCPALNVLGMIPLVAELVPDMLENAEVKMAERWAHRWESQARRAA